MMMNKLVPFPPSGAQEHARAETERKRRLFAWADDVLRQLGLADRISQSNSFDELRKITFDPDAVEVALAIRDALHPASGRKADCFTGFREGSLKRLLQNRFNELKKQREAELQPGLLMRATAEIRNRGPIARAYSLSSA
jgi:hypothetical protein